MAAPAILQNNMASTVRLLGSRLVNICLSFERNAYPFQNVRGIKQIVHTEKPDGTTVISGSFVQSSRAPQLIRIDEHRNCNACYMCNLNLNVKHTDVLILSQFLRTDGCMLPRRVTGLCKRQQKRVTYMVAMAQKAGLLSSINPPGSHKDPRKRYGWKKWNSYWDEDTIKC